MTTDTTGSTDADEAGTPGTGRTVDEAVVTYRYLRIAMVMLLAGIAVSVAVEFVHNGAGCLQESISAYYYTPVRAFFVSAVLALGVCMVAIRGIGAEETFLNLAGMFAPVVALVPTPHPGDCTSDPAMKVAGPASAVFNNMTALFWIAPLCVLYLVVLRWIARRQGKGVSVPPKPALLVPVVVVWGLALLLFLKDEDHSWFVDHGHLWSAFLMFGCIVVVVALNGISLARKLDAEEQRKPPEARDPARQGSRAFDNRYTRIAVVMVASFLLMFAFRHGWHHWIFTVEATLLGLFLLFWTFQTEELWDEVVRTGDPRTVPPPMNPPAV